MSACGSELREGTIVAVPESVKSAYTVRSTTQEELHLFRHEIHPVSTLANFAHSDHSSRELVYEAVLDWHPFLAGRTFLLLPNKPLQLRLKRPFRFEVPDVDSTAGGAVVLHVRLDDECAPASFALSMVPAPWVTSLRHWRLGTHWGVAEGQAALLKPSSPDAPRPPRPVAEQSPDGSVRLLTQAHAGGKHLSVVSPHLMLADEHVFAFEIVTCARDRATGLRVGVCSEDGRQHWVLRLSDGRLCDASGAPLTEELAPQEDPFNGRRDFMRLDNHSPTMVASRAIRSASRGGGAQGGACDSGDTDGDAIGSHGSSRTSRHEHSTGKVGKSIVGSKAYWAEARADGEGDEGSLAQRVRIRDPVIDPTHLPCMMQRAKVEVRVLISHPRSLVSFRIEGNKDGQPATWFNAPRDLPLPQALRPCVHLYFRNDAVRLCDHRSRRVLSNESRGRLRQAAEEAGARAAVATATPTPPLPAPPSTAQPVTPTRERHGGLNSSPLRVHEDLATRGPRGDRKVPTHVYIAPTSEPVPSVPSVPSAPVPAAVPLGRRAWGEKPAEGGVVNSDAGRWGAEQALLGREGQRDPDVEKARHADNELPPLTEELRGHLLAEPPPLPLGRPHPPNSFVSHVTVQALASSFASDDSSASGAAIEEQARGFTAAHPWIYEVDESFEPVPESSSSFGSGKQGRGAVGSTCMLEPSSLHGSSPRAIAAAQHSRLLQRAAPVHSSSTTRSSTRSPSPSYQRPTAVSSSKLARTGAAEVSPRDTHPDLLFPRQLARSSGSPPPHRHPGRWSDTSRECVPSVDKYIAVSTPVAKSVRAVPREAKDLLRLGLASSLERLAERFRARDGAQSGEIGFDEFRLSLAQLGLFAKLATFGHSLAVAEAAAETLFGEFDGDGSGVISCEEFLRYALRDALRQSLTRVIDLFRQLDSDRDGKIGLAEFGKVLKAAGVVAPEDVLERLFAQMDLDGDGAIDPKELHRVLRSEDVKLEGVMYV